MRKYNISDNTLIKEKNISKIIESYFGTVSKKDENAFVVDEPDNPTLEEIFVEVQYESKTIILDIEEKELSEIKSNNLLSNVPEAVKSKNKFLKEVTGTTVEDRKNKWRKDVMPTKENVIRVK